MSLINFEGHVFEDEMPDLDSYVRRNLNFGICFYEKNSKRKEMQCYCPTLNYSFKQDYEPQNCKCSKGFVSESYICVNEVGCNYCGCKFYNSKYPNKNLKREFDVGFFQKSDRGIVFRAFRLTYRFDSEYVEPQGISCDDYGGYRLERHGDVEYEETERIFYNYDRTVEVYNKYVRVYNPYTGYSIGVKSHFSKTKFPYVVDICYIDSTFEDLKKLLFKSFYEYMKDFEENLSLADEDINLEVFLYALLRYPLLLALKYGFYKVANEIYEAVGRGRLSDLKGINSRGKSIEKVLGFDLSKLPHSLADDLTCDEVSRVKFAIKHGVRITKDNFRVITDYDFQQLFNYISLKEMSVVIRYILVQKRKHKNVFVSEFLFYLKNAQKYSFDLSNKELLYPVNLSTAHDKMIKLVNKRNADFLLKGFFKNVIRFCKYKLEYKDFYITPVLTPKSLRRNADKFHNCSYGHCDSICEGKSVIFVVKSKFEPLIPLYMFDYSPKSQSLVQLRGVKNKNAPLEIVNYVNSFVELLKAKKVNYA